jgi:signal peptidase I
MFFLTPRYLKQGRQFAKDARKLLAYKRDLWSVEQSAAFEASIQKLENATKARSQTEVESTARDLDALCTANLPPVTNAGWRENVEVFLVAIVVALGVRTYFLQPFTIPTGSMYPTLNGIIGYPTQTPPPNPLLALWQTVWNGRTWVDVPAKADETIESVQEVTRFLFATYTRVQTDRNVYLLHIPSATARDYFFIRQGRRLHAGEPIARGYHETGDHVFVDKFTYHFRKPKREEVFVFNTAGIETIENRNNPAAPSQFYIKRLAGEPLDELRIDPPNLFIGGALAKGKSFGRVMSRQGEYGGYGLGFPSFLMPILRSPDQTYTVPAEHYFALGDNSYHSSDSRDWGPVPQKNIMGRGVFVYWPFRPHFGTIK